MNGSLKHFLRRPEGFDDLLAGSPDRREEAAEEAHHEREGKRLDDNFRREDKAESQLGEGGEVGR